MQCLLYDCCLLQTICLFLKLKHKPLKLKKGIQNSTKLNLKECIDYSEGSIVSKIVIKQPKGNATLFAFDAGEELSEHTAPFDALVQIIDGESKVKVGDQTHHLVSGESILMPANVPHALKAETQFKMLLTMIRE